MEQGLKLARHAVAVVPSERAGGGEVDVGHINPLVWMIKIILLGLVLLYLTDCQRACSLFIANLDSAHHLSDRLSQDSTTTAIYMTFEQLISSQPRSCYLNNP